MIAKLRNLLLVVLLLAIDSACNSTDQPVRAGSIPPAAPASTAPEPEKPAPTKDVSFDDVKFNHVKGTPFDESMLTPAIKKLDGTAVRMRGYILPSFQQSGIKRFVLVRDNMQCCFGPGAAVFDCIVVEMVEGTSAEYTVRPVSVEGRFSIKEVVGAEGNPLAVYHLDGKEVK